MTYGKLKPGPKPKTWEERVFKYIDKKSKPGCWIWTGPISETGVPMLSMTTEERKSRRHPYYIRAYFFHQNYNPDPYDYKPRQFRNTTCQEKLCVYPDHILINNTHFNHKLDQKDINDIRERWKLNVKYGTNLNILAREYGVTRQRIHQIVSDLGVVE